jgi:hypothetical protein
VILDEAEALLDPVSDIEGFMLACLVDASTGMVLASRKDQDDISLPTATAGAADIANVLMQLTPATSRACSCTWSSNGRRPTWRWPGTISSASRTTSRSEGPGRRTSLSGPGRHPHGPADQWMAKSARVYPSALTVGWMKLFSII